MWVFQVLLRVRSTVQVIWWALLFYPPFSSPPKYIILRALYDSLNFKKNKLFISLSFSLTYLIPVIINFNPFICISNQLWQVSQVWAAQAHVFKVFAFSFSRFTGISWMPAYMKLLIHQSASYRLSIYFPCEVCSVKRPWNK